MKKIAIFQANLKVGGIQRSLANLLRSNILNGFEVHVYLFSKDIFFDTSLFSDNITIKFLKPFPYWCRFIPFNILKKIYKDLSIDDTYDYAIDFDSYQQDCSLYTISLKKSKKIMWIHNDLVREYKYNKKYRILYHFFRQKFKYYDEFVAVSEGVVEPFRKKSRQFHKKITVIPNLIDTSEIFQKSQLPTNIEVEKEKCNIACMGRIYVAKGYDFLLKDFKKAYEKRKDLRLYIIGDGPERLKYEKWVKYHKLDGVVSFLGNQKNPFNLLKQMDAFCLESRYEGQGMVLLEAKALGLSLIFPKRLEKYNAGLQGVDNIVDSLVAVKRKNNNYNDLKDYNQMIYFKYKELLSD